MTLSVKISADVSGAENGLRRLERQLERTGQAARGIKLEKMSIAKDVASDDSQLLETVKRNWAMFATTARGHTMRQRAKKYGQEPDNPLQWDFGAMYGNRTIATRMMRDLSEVLTGIKYSQPQQPSLPPPSPPSGEPAEDKGSLMKRAAQFAGRMTTRFGALAGAAIVKGGWDAYHARAEALTESEDVWKRMGGREDYDEFLGRLRGLGAELQLTTAEAAKLTTGFSKAAGAVDAGIVDRSRLAGQFARGYGMRPDEGADFFGRAEYMGVGAGKEQQRQFAMLIGEATAKGRMSGKPEQVFQDMLASIQKMEAATGTVPTEATLARAAALHAQLYQNPASKGQVGRYEDALQSVLKSDDLINQAFLFRAFNGQFDVRNPYEFQRLKDANIMQTPFEVLGHGDKSTALLDFMMRQTAKEGEMEFAAGIGASAEEAAAGRLSGYTHGALSLPQAEQFGKDYRKMGGMGGFSEWAKKNGIDLSKINDWGVTSDLAGLAAGTVSPEELKKKYLDEKKELLRGGDEERLRNASGEELARILPGIIAAAVPTNDAQTLRSLPADISRELEKQFGGALVDIMNEMRETELIAIHNAGEDAHKIVHAIEIGNGWLEQIGKKLDVDIPEGHEVRIGQPYLSPKDEDMPQAADWLKNTRRKIWGEDDKGGEGSVVGSVKGIWDRLRRYFDPEHVAGIMGNISQESSFKTGASGDSGRSFGLAQWLGDRKKALYDFAQGQGKKPNDPTVQADFIAQEMTTTEQKALRELLKTKTPEDAALAVSKHYERPKLRYANNDYRVSEARRFYEKFAKSEDRPADKPVGAELAGRASEMTKTFDIPKTPEDADTAVRYNEQPSSSQARFDGQIDLNINQVDAMGRTVLQQQHILRPEPSPPGVVKKGATWNVDYEHAWRRQ